VELFIPNPIKKGRHYATRVQLFSTYTHISVAGLLIFSMQTHIPHEQVA
jgi:hypothetical protein